MGNSDIGKSIMERRNELGITQSHLAELSDVSVNTVYKIERGQANPSLNVLIKILDVIGMEIKMEVKKKF